MPACDAQSWTPRAARRGRNSHHLPTFPPYFPQNRLISGEFVLKTASNCTENRSTDAVRTCLPNGSWSGAEPVRNRPKLGLLTC